MICYFITLQYDGIWFDVDPVAAHLRGSHDRDRVAACRSRRKSEVRSETTFQSVARGHSLSPRMS